jgi:hypothetical protein
LSEPKSQEFIGWLVDNDDASHLVSLLVLSRDDLDCARFVELMIPAVDCRASPVNDEAHIRLIHDDDVVSFFFPE